MNKKLAVSLPNIQPNKAITIVRFVTSNHKIYHCAQHHFLKLKPIDRSFYDYLCEHMTQENRVTISSTFIQGYIDFLKKITSNLKEVSASTISRAMKTLVEEGLLIKGRGNSALYFVNPKYASKVSDTKRKDVIRKIVSMQLQNGLSIAPLLDFSLTNTEYENQ